MLEVMQKLRINATTHIFIQAFVAHCCDYDKQLTLFGNLKAGWTAGCKTTIAVLIATQRPLNANASLPCVGGWGVT